MGENGREPEPQKVGVKRRREFEVHVRENTGGRQLRVASWEVRLRGIRPERGTIHQQSTVGEGGRKGVS